MTNKERQTPGVIDVCVGEDYRIYLCNRYREAKIFLVAFTSLSLEKTVVEDDSLSADTQNVARACYFSCSANELDLHSVLKKRRSPSCALGYSWSVQ